MIKRLLWDIETSPNLILDFACGYNKHITYNQIIKERAIICICYKWMGSKKVYHLNWDKNQCDKKMIKDFLKVLNQADESIAHNGDKFDLKWLRGRCFIHNIPMFPKYTTIDTLKLSRSKFNLNSNRLDYLDKLIGGEGKIKTSWEMWQRITLENHKPSLNKMIKYCKQDVLVLEEVYNRMKNYIEPKATVERDYKCQCPECGSFKTVVNNRRRTQSGVKLQIRCNDCGKYHTVSELQYNKAIREKQADDKRL